MNVSLLNIISESKSIWDSIASQNYGIILLAQILRDNGHNVSVYNNKTLKFNLERVVKTSDAICFSFFTPGANTAYNLSKQIKKLSQNLPIIMGGIHPSCLPNEALRHSDFVIRGEGEIALPNLLNLIESGSMDFHGIPNLSYKFRGEVINNPSAKMIENKKILQTSPAMDLDPNKHSWNRTPVLTPGRGCPYSCNFCSNIFGKKMRLNDPKWVVSEIERIVKNDYYNPSKVVFFGSDNFAANRKWAKDVLELSIKEDLAGKVNYHIQTRTDIANDKELLDLMKPFVTRVYIGVESFDDEVLKDLKKGISAEEMQRQLNIIITKGIPVHAHLICGTNYDTVEKINKTVETAKKTGVYGISLFTLTPFPETKLREQMNREKRIITNNWDHYDLHHVTIAPINEKPSSIQKAVIEGYQNFYSLNRVIKNSNKLFSIPAIAYNLFLWNGFRNYNLNSYIRTLENWEKERYNVRHLKI